MTQAFDTPADAAPWQLCLLGASRLVGGDRVVVLSPKDAALLALAALAAPVRAERVAALLWPAASARQADASLRQRIYRLRREVRAPLLASGAHLALAPQVRTDLAAALERLERDESAAVAELLGDLDYADLPEFAEWLGAERRRWRERCHALLASAADRCEKDGAIVRGLVYARRLADGDALAEHAHRRLMRLHYLRGDRASAIAAFEQFERRLKDELGTRPSAETIELLATIERGGATLPAHRAVAPASLLRPPRLVGRRAELAALAGAWAAERVFLLSGEAGIGKSRLLWEFVAGQDGALSIAARPGDAGVATASMARLLRAVLDRHAVALGDERRRELALLLPELGVPVACSGPAQRRLLQRAVEATLIDAVALGLRAVILDDLHCADPASLELLQALLECERLQSLRWGFAQRPADASDAITPWRRALEETRRLEGLALAPLGLAQLAELVESLGLPELDATALAPALLRHSGGNPLFALETLRDMVLSPEGAALGAAGRLPQPRSVAALVERRLGQLSAPALKLARVAALAGADFSAELAAAVLDAHPLDLAEPWRELEAAHVVREGAFAHDLIFEATQASVPAPIAALLHRRIAEHLQAAGRPAAAVAPHWLGAQCWALAGQAYVAAARQAQAASQRTHEIDCWERAGQAFERAGDAALAFEARCDGVPACIIVRGVERAHAVIDGLEAAASTPTQRVAALNARALAALMAADHARGMAAAVEAVALARDFDTPWPAITATRLRAVALAQAGRAAEGLALLEPLRARVEAEGSLEQRGGFWADNAYVLNGLRRLRETAHALTQSIAIAQQMGDLAELAMQTANLATVKGNLGHLDEALELAQRALALKTQLGEIDGPEGAVIRAYAGLYCGMVGRYGEALEHLDAAIAVLQRDRQLTLHAVACNHKAQFLVDLGQYARARQALDYEAPPVLSVRARGAHVAARIDRALGAAAAPHLSLALQVLDQADEAHVRMHVLLEVAEGSEPAAAIERCDEVLRMARQLEFDGVAMKARLLRAHAVARNGQTAQAAQEMREVVAAMASVPPVDLYRGEAWWRAAQVFDAAGDSAQALLALAHGTQWVRQQTLPQVPEAFRDSFLQRNAANRALLAAADRRLGG
jgi:DNA-binding SARP family transcriptional activator/tetratricopeptide (TPR) repeat protein